MHFHDTTLVHKNYSYIVLRRSFIFNDTWRHTEDDVVVTVKERLRPFCCIGGVAIVKFLIESVVIFRCFFRRNFLINIILIGC